MAIKYGIPVLFQDVNEYIDPVVDNVLEKNIQTESGRTFVMLGSSEVDYDPHFRMYLTTKLANPQFNPAAYAKAVVINYTVTVQGLEDQLLSVVVRAERADLEEQRESLILETSANKSLLSGLEDSLLRELATSTGNMLDNVELVNTLENTKSKAGEASIFERHKLLYSFQMDIKLEQSEGNVSQMELDFFIKGNVSLEKSARACPASWIPGPGWQDIMKLANDFPGPFSMLPDNITAGLEEWQEWFDSDTPESATIPNNYRETLKPFEILMLLRCFRVDRIYRALTDYITVTMGEEYITPPTYFKMRPHALEECAHPAYKKLVYVLAFFHAVVQERRKYDKIGWNISYDFSESDFLVCMQILTCYLDRCAAANGPIPWATLKYLFGEVMYGGRVIDDYDRRVVGTYMEEYMGEFLFDKFQPFHFYHDSVFDYVIPPDGERDEYIEFIDLLPLANSPEVFGLHPNAEIGYFSQAVREMWGHLIELQPQTSEGGGAMSREDFIDLIAVDVLGKLPPLYEIWRATMEEPIVIWLSGLHIPESYLIAHVQIACRLFTWPLDRSTQFTRGCYVRGLYLEGARWDIEDACLRRSHPKVLVTELPIMYIIPIEAHKLKLQNTIPTPVYTTSTRRNAMGVGLVFQANLWTAEHPSHWVLQGVCLIMNTD
ncbi:hypothetical protein MSG28_008800 [Choristoneura fumiferana]|uniref:Uncharacterized protein n=1 Tax=Choristoneura fumiferana TaxID=7141 RepID=A0ACC0J821_CHOFU|nr:hypothetical protein MSG28_008800 [Choristoneura fumiferana]